MTEPQSIIFEQGSEYAPDARWGYQRVRVSTDGKLEYEQKRAGQTIAT